MINPANTDYSYAAVILSKAPKNDKKGLPLEGRGSPVVEPPKRALWAIKRDGEMKKQGVSRSAASE